MLEAFASLEPGTDLVLLAGDLTTCGGPDEAAVLAEACRQVEVPVCAVLGNHDWHLNRTQEVAAVLGRRRDPSARAQLDAVRAARPRRRCGRAEGLRRRLPGLRAARLRGAAPTRGVRGDDEGRDRARPGARDGRRRRPPHRAPPLRADDDDARGRAARDLAVPRQRPPGRADRASIRPTSSSTATPTRAPSRATSGASRSTTSRSRSREGTSGTSTSARASARTKPSSSVSSLRPEQPSGGRVRGRARGRARAARCRA